MPRIALIVFLSCTLFAADQAQTPPKTIDAALRQRVSEFYQNLMNGKYQQAERLVASDSKNFFVGTMKPTFSSFEIKRINYTENFHQASVILLVKRLVPLEGFMGHPVPGMIPSHWRIEHGKWYWYTDPSDVDRSPFAVGQLPASPQIARGGVLPQTTPSGHALPPMPNMSVLLVSIDKNNVFLKSGSSDQVTLSNKLRTPVTLSLMDPQPPGLKLSLDRTDLNAGDTARLKIESERSPAQPDPATVRVMVQQTKQIISIKVTLLPSPEPVGPKQGS